MTHIEDPMKVMADLRPTDLERLARDGYMRHRSDDLARLAVDAIGAGGTVLGPGQVAAVAQWGHGAVTVASWPSRGLA